MNNIFADIWAVISSMSFIDFILYFSVILLIVLIVSLIYVIYAEKMENNNNNTPLDTIENTLAKIEENPIQEEIKEENVAPKEDLLDLSAIINEINENPKPIVDMTAYEEEQEQRAIISYDELLESAKSEIRYEKEEMVDDVIPVKKISLDASIPQEITYLEKEPKIEIDTIERDSETTEPLFSYRKEEAFLKSLQQLNELLNHSNL